MLPELTAAGTEIIDEKDSSKTSSCPNHLVNIKAIDDTKGAEDGRRDPKYAIIWLVLRLSWSILLSFAQFALVRYHLNGSHDHEELGNKGNHETGKDCQGNQKRGFPRTCTYQRTTLSPCSKSSMLATVKRV